MPKANDAPESLRPYIFHGVELQYRPNDKEAVGDCPWCGRVDKFSVNIATGKWRCLLCNEGGSDSDDKPIKGGNAYSFIRRVWELSYDQTTSADYLALTRERLLLDDNTPLHWQLAKSFLTGDWLLPGYNSNRKLTGLYRYVRVNNRKAWLPTPTLGHHLFGVDTYNVDCETVYLCEGVWDAMAFWEVASLTKQTSDTSPAGKLGLAPTSNIKASLLSNLSVLAIPGCEVFFESWLPLFAGKHVVLLGQNDHARTHPKTGKPIAPASYNGMRRITAILSTSDTPPRSISWLRWGPDGYNPRLPTGYDVRDMLAGQPTAST